MSFQKPKGSAIYSLLSRRPFLGHVAQWEQQSLLALFWKSTQCILDSLWSINNSQRSWRKLGDTDVHWNHGFHLVIMCPHDTVWSIRLSLYGTLARAFLAKLALYGTNQHTSSFQTGARDHLSEQGNRKRLFPYSETSAQTPPQVHQNRGKKFSSSVSTNLPPQKPSLLIRMQKTTGNWFMLHPEMQTKDDNSWTGP